VIFFLGGGDFHIGFWRIARRWLTNISENDSVLRWCDFDVRFNVAKIMRRQNNRLGSFNELQVAQGRQLQRTILQRITCKSPIILSLSPRISRIESQRLLTGLVHDQDI